MMLYVCLIGFVIGMGLVAGRDADDAEHTAQYEQEVHQRYLDLQAAVRYQPTSAPIRASTLEVTFTACQQLPNRKWECVAQ